MTRRDVGDSVIRFGAFELDRASSQLRKSGVRLKLQEQPFQVLAALLEKPGELVTREEPKERLWSGDTFVDFDRGLNTAINKIREALGDSAQRPRFVETVPKGTASLGTAGWGCIRARVLPNTRTC